MTRKFEPTIASLLDYRCPDWFRDAKFGIYLHWGVYSVPEQAEWYARNMYLEGHPDYHFHLEHYGHPSEFGYKDLVPLWKAERWDPERLASLFKRAGARYFAPCAIHHDNFDLWNSKYNRWNSVEMGPKRDITGEWRRAALAEGLRFGVTTHLERTWSWLQTNKGADRSGPKKGVLYDGNDPEFSDFYLEANADTDLRHPRNAPPAWREHWARRIIDLIDTYHPDLLYFDGGIPFLGDDNGQTGMKVISHLYNHSIDEHEGRQESVMCVKRLSDHGIYVDGVTTLDLERTKLDAIRELPWQTDTSIGPWGYKSGAPYRSATVILHELIDIVSKNGNVLLNVPPRADGSLDEETEDILAAIGTWMEINGEAIYETRPWKSFGRDDIRFTRRSDALYVILLEWPSEKQIEFPELAEYGGIGPIRSVSLLGHKGEIRWGQSREERGALRVVLPEMKPCDHAWCLKIEWDT